MKEFENISGKNPFKVPEKYFEDINRKIISSTVESTPDIRKKGLLRRLRPYLLAAASVAGFIIITYSTARLISSGRHKTPEVYAENMAEPYLIDIDIISLEDKLNSPEISDDMSGVRESDIIDYLMLENIEIDDIFEQL
jgi:hypothetical protein